MLQGFTGRKSPFLTLPVWIETLASGFSGAKNRLLALPYGENRIVRMIP